MTILDDWDWLEELQITDQTWAESIIEDRQELLAQEREWDCFE